MKKILVCLNASPNAKAIMNAAGFFAKLSPDIQIEILHVLTPSDNVDMIDYSAMMGMDTTGQYLDALTQIDAQKSQLARERGELILKNAVDYLITHYQTSETQITTTLKKGYFADILREYEADTAFMILGKHGENSFKNGKLIGAHLEQIIRTHKKPVFVACQNFSPICKPLIAFDDSEKSHRAIDFIIENLAGHITQLDLLTVQDHEHQVSQAVISDVKSKLSAAKISAEFILATGDVIDAIDQKITHHFYDILFAGAYSHSQFHSFVFGSTTHNILTKTNISLFLFP